MRIGINCGHTVSGQPGCGAVGYIDESVETRNVGRALERIFKNAGHTVIDCTNDYAATTSGNLSEIVRMANAQPLDLFVSIHFNAGGGKGTEVYTYGGKTFLEAENVCKSIAALGFNNRGVKDGSSLYVVHRTDAKAMLVEVCFVDTNDTDKYKSIGCDKVAAAIYAGITGAPAAVKEYTDAGEIVDELKRLGILADAQLWKRYCGNDANVYWLCRKLVNYAVSKPSGESADGEYTEINDIVWDLHHREIITDALKWTEYMKNDANVYWLMRKGLHWCRTH